MIYEYEKVDSPNLDNIETDILDSTFDDTYIYLRWDEVETGKELEVHLSRELTTGEKIELDNIVNN